MTLRKALAGLLQFFAVLLFFGAGILLIALYFAPESRLLLVHTLSLRPDLFALSGIVLVGTAILLTLGFLSLERGQTLLLRMGTEVDAKIIRHSIDALLRKEFATRVRLSQVRILQGKELEIGLELDALDPKAQEAILLDAERHLKTLLGERFGYRKSFSVQATVR